MCEEVSQFTQLKQSRDYLLEVKAGAPPANHCMDSYGLSRTLLWACLALP